MKASTLIKLQAFLETILQLEETFDEDTDEKITIVANNLDEIARQSPQLEVLYKSARKRIIKDYQTQSRSKFVGELPETSEKSVTDSFSVEKNESSKKAWDQWFQEVEEIAPISTENNINVDKNKYPLRGTPIVYIMPTEPVAEDDWEAAQ